MKIPNLIVMLMMMLLLSSCYTVQGAFQGAGKDTRAVANELQLN